MSVDQIPGTDFDADLPTVAYELAATAEDPPAGLRPRPHGSTRFGR